ncbi:hypothetical protein ACGF5C_31510 [Micromonospora sp. NPDC047620]|uniref:hypothetical protein n=1 Tax=Micromonospora sp. NPDC047620 TaxID=3364251 RepID=UPI00371875CB
MTYVLPDPPGTSMVLDRDGIEWRGQDGTWTASPCPQCRTRLGTMTWPELLQDRGPLSDVPLPPAGAAMAGEG